MVKNRSAFKKSFFEQFGKDIEEEHKEHETYQEKTKVEDNKCLHKKTRLVGRELRCGCGAFWTGTASDLIRTKEILEKNSS